MTSLTVENISLTHPIAGYASSGAGDAGDEDDKFVRSGSGRILGVRALSGVSFSLTEGNRLGLIGRNGSGKTTLLRVLAGILPPDQGRVVMEGHATNLININLGMKADATGHRNITLQGLASGRKRREIEERRAEIAAFSELGEFLDFPVSTYSAGMRMRLSFAVATAFEPEILLLDEWLSAGDERFKMKATERMSSFVERAGIIVLASHSRSLLTNNCDQVMWLDSGRIKKIGPVKDVLDEYEAVMRRA